MNSKDLKQLQNLIQEFSDERGWSGALYSTYNMLCNIAEESGEIWNVIKWTNTEEDIKEVIRLNREELKDGIGDLLWCVARLAITFDVDMFEALEARLEEYRKRFPVEKVKNRKANPTLGGFDGKYSS